MDKNGFECLFESLERLKNTFEYLYKQYFFAKEVYKIFEMASVNGIS